MREIPVTQLASRTDELLAYAADQPEWTLKLATEKLAPRIVADIFNLITIGDGLVGADRIAPAQQVVDFVGDD